MRIEGLGEHELNEVWADRPEAYLGTTVAGFPNMFVMYGPNTNHGSGSVPYTLECQFNYVMDAIEPAGPMTASATSTCAPSRPTGGVRWRSARPTRSG